MDLFWDGLRIWTVRIKKPNPAKIKCTLAQFFKADLGVKITPSFSGFTPRFHEFHDLSNKITLNKK